MSNDPCGKEFDMGGGMTGVCGRFAGHIPVDAHDLRERKSLQFYGYDPESRARWGERIWWREFADAWVDIGRPFSKCVYCNTFKLGYFPGEKYTPKAHCNDEQFVRGVVYSFPMLRRDAPGLTPWIPNKWARWWRTSGAQTSGSYHAVAFCLSLWSGCNSEHWKRRGYSFDVVAAFGVWDHAHVAAFMKLCNNPWRP